MGCCRYFCSAIFVAILSMTGMHMYKTVGLPDWWWESKMPDFVTHIDVADSAKMKHVFFSGEPWLIQCYSGLPYAGQHLPFAFRLDETFVESVKSMRDVVKGGTLDCEAKLPNNPNKTLISKFGLVRRTKPLLLYAGGGDRPKQLPAASASSVYGVTAWVKPKAEPKVRVARSPKALGAYCGGRRACLLTNLPAASTVLEQLARAFRTIEVVTVGDGMLSWGRGEEVGETLEPEEAVHFGKAISLLRADPDAPKPTRKGARPPPRLLRGYSGEEDFSSIASFVEFGLSAGADDADGEGKAFVRAELPSIKLPERKKERKPKKAKAAESASESAARQAKRAKARAEAAAKAEEKMAAMREEMKTKTEEQRREAENRRRAQMAEEEANAANILEEVDGDDDDEGDDDEEEVVDMDDGETEDDGSDVLDLDA